MSGEEPKDHNKVNDKEMEAINSTENISAGKRKLSEEKAASEGEIENNERRKSDDMEPATSNNNVLVKTEREAESSNDVAENGITCPVKIKREPVEEVEADSVAPDGASTSASANAVAAVGASTSAPSIAIKTEPTVVKAEPSYSSNNNSQSAGADSTVTSSSLRPSCRFGIRCYRQNPAHRRAEAHPGEPDYRRPNFPDPPLGTPACPFGNLCYRRNPVHFQQFSHPPDFNSAQNIRNRLRQRRTQATNANNGGTADYSDTETDEEDPFGDECDSDVDYKPGANVDDDSEEEEEDLEFNSERQNFDEYD